MEGKTLTIQSAKNEGALQVELTGRLDTTTAPELERALKDELEGVTELTLDLAGLEYLSSAGLRVLLGAQKVMNRQGTMKVCHVNSVVRDIFEITGFSDILTIV